VKKIFYLMAFLFYSTHSLAAVVKIKNFREIYSSLATMMNMNESNQTLKDAFVLVKDRLPKTGSAQEFSSPTLMALTELSGTFCRETISKEEKLGYGERTLFSDINFDRGPIQFSSYLSDVLSKKLSRIFWQREIRPEESVVIENLIFSSIGKNLTNPAETEKIVQVVCTAFTSSLAFITK
jgi:hypothetical protein